ncbi:hypothetical protein ACXYMO_01860 [Arenibacterium sp. CAU 1754]
MMQPVHIARPDLTMPEAEAAHLRAVYARADVILEYGSGGSTALAAEMPGKAITSVESDRAWKRMMDGWFAENPPAKGTSVDMIHADIGPTKDWGQPADDRGWKRYARYPLAVWQRDGFVHPDVVLVDGRFRIGCALATAFSITRPVTLLFDDYANRARHHQVEEFIGTPNLIGRMGEFQITPTSIPANKLLQIIRFMLRP